MGKVGDIKDVPKHQIYMNNTNTQALTNYEKAADDVLEVLDGFGFRTDIPFDPKEFRKQIVEAIRRNVEKKEIVVAPPMYSITGSYAFNSSYLS